MIRKNTIYSGFNGERRHTLDHLSKTYNWLPASIIDIWSMRAWARENYEGAVFYDSMQLRNAQFDYTQLGNKAMPVDEEIIGALSKYESFCLDLMEDTTGWNFSFSERRNYYYDLLRFWNTVIQQLKPDMFVIWTWPHVITDYVLYRLCTYYKIPVLFINPVPLFNYDENQYYYVSDSLEDQSSVVMKEYPSDKVYEISDDLKKYFDSVRDKKGITPPHMTYYWNNPGKRWNTGFGNDWIRECFRLMKLFLTGRLFEKFDVSWKCNRLPFDSLKSRLNYLQYIVFKEHIRREDGKLKEIYSSYMIKNPDLGRKYIYYAAAFQPEAGIWSVYQDQLLILDILSASIPDDWVIYYKEHPSTFLEGEKASLVRNREYYKRISAYKNVEMISPEISTFKLIDTAQAVVTPSGTVGWESIIRGTPALIFGHVWYRGCNSVFKIVTKQDCMEAIEKIKNGYKPDQSDIERFAAAFQKVAGKNIIDGDFIINTTKSYCHERIARLFYDTYERNHISL